VPDAEFELTLWGRYARGGGPCVTGRNSQVLALLLCYRDFERRLTPDIEWGEKRGRHAIAAFERGAWDFALSHCLERSVDASTTISKLKSFDIACRSHLPTQRTPEILDCGHCIIDLSLRRVVGEPIADFDMVKPIRVPSALGPLLPSRPLDAARSPLRI